MRIVIFSMIASAAISQPVSAQAGGCQKSGQAYDTSTGKPVLICTPKLTIGNTQKNSEKATSAKSVRKIPRKSITD